MYRRSGRGGRDDVVRDRIFLQGWSNDGSTTLNVMIRQGVRVGGFRAALVFYPKACEGDEAPALDRHRLSTPSHRRQ
jgi:dienelactone hydrolase